MKKPAPARASSFSHATFLVLLAAAARARVVTTYSRRSLWPGGRARGHLPFLGLPVPERGKFRKKRPAVRKKAFVACTQIVQPSFAIGRSEDAILRAPSIAKIENVAFQAIAGKGVPFELAEGPQRRTFDEIDQSGLTNVPQVVFPVDEVIAGKEISVVFDHGNIPAGFLEDTQGMLLS